MPDVPLLSASELTIRRDGQVILENVALSVMPGEIHVVIGPNGAGKSSLLGALLGQTVFSGAVRCHFRGSGRIGLVPQSFPVDRTLPVTVTEFLALSRQRLPICFGVRSAARGRIRELLEQVGLPEIGSRRLGALSGGELRRVLLANAMDPEPELIFLDEPASGLDQASAARLEEILLAMRKAAGTTVIMVSHDLAQVRRLADRVTWLDRSVRAAGSPAEVLGDKPFFPFADPGLPAPSSPEAR
jgi:zinc transport system ATP-binding protein